MFFMRNRGQIFQKKSCLFRQVIYNKIECLFVTSYCAEGIRKGVFMFNSNVFDYVNVMEKAADASWQRNNLIANNLANVDTPGYKRKDIDFESQLRRALGNSRYETVDAKVAHISGTELEPRVYTDSANFSYRLDGNNVDIDTENIELASNQLKYNGLITGINHNFSTLKMVLK